MRVLALDTSTAACSVAIRDTAGEPDSLVAHQHEAMERGQSEALAPMIRAVLRDAGAGIRDMDFLAVTTGPGAFTGVRIGLAMARSLGMSAGLPVRGVSTMEAVAHGVPSAAHMDTPDKAGRAWTVVVMDTKRDDVYVQVFDDRLAPAGEPDIIAPEDIVRVLDSIVNGRAAVIAGDAVERVEPYVAGRGESLRVWQNTILPDAAVIADISLVAGPPLPNSPFPTPVYLRPPYAKISPTGGKLRP